LLNDWNFNYLFSDGFNNLVDSHNNWVVNWQLYDLWNLNDLFVVSFNFINSWNLSGDGNDLFHNVRYFDDLLNS
jgi:hypothetical protein